MIGQKAATRNLQTVEWKMTVNTEATATGEKKTGIPFNLYGCTGAYLDVDWGDGTSVRLQPSDYTQSNSTASVHEYAEPGEYQISIKSRLWNKISILAIEDETVITTPINSNASLYWWRRTLISIDNVLPILNGKNYYRSYNSTTLYNRTTIFSYLFCNCSKLQSIPSELFDKNTAITSLRNCFHGCSSLQSIPSGLFDKNTAVTEFIYCFHGCSSLASISSGLFDKNTAVTDFSWCFAYCSSLQSIPEGLFDNNTAATIFSNCFYGCSSLQSIPEGLFDNNTAATNFYMCFAACTSLQTIPSGLFDKNTAATSFYRCFDYCTSLQSIPAGLFDNNTAVTDFCACFCDCSSLQSIPTDLFRYNVNAIDFCACFCKCSSIQSIPTDLFRYNVNATNIKGCFNGCSSLQSIPENLFRYNVNVVDFQSCFHACTSLQSIPENLFRYNVNATSFGDCFGNCTSLQNISENLFKYNTAITTFYANSSLMTWTSYGGCFQGCTGLTSIPSGLFDNNTAVTSFYQCFCNCSSLQSIPSGLFDNNTAATTFGNCFTNCTSLQSIPEGLFDKNTAVTSFNECFRGCTSLQSIPEGLFDKNTTVNDFEYCFYDCTSIQSIPSGLFDKNTAVTSFSYCFYNCYSLKDFKLFIGSPLVTNFSYFISSATNVTRTICVPANSTTYTKLTAYANTSNNITVSTIEIDCMEAFVYTIDTEATTTGAVTGQIPLSVIDTTKSKKIYIDWDDGSGVEILSSELASNATHTYASPGEYQITVATVDWSNYTLQSNTSTTFKDTLISVDKLLPPFANATLDNLFYGCLHLESITGNLLDNHTEKTSAKAAFKGCSSLAEIPASLLKKMEGLTTVDSMFEGCSALTYIPSGLLSQCRALTSTEKMFKDCTGLTYFPNTLLLNNTILISTTDMFNGCTNSSPTMYTKTQLEESNHYVELYDTDIVSNGNHKVAIPIKLKNQEDTITVDWGDGSSETLVQSSYTNSSAYDASASIHQYSNSGLYFVDMQSSNWSNIYLTTNNYDITDDTRYTSLYYRRQSLIELSTRLPAVKGRIDIQSTSNSLYTNSLADLNHYCRKLKYIPSNYFEQLQSFTNFFALFCDCTSLASIPAGLFDNNPLVTNFQACFSGCTSLTSVPTELFKTNTSSFINLTYLFSNCTSLASIPANLFGVIIPQVNFQSCFSYCKSLTSIPVGLFDNVNATSFWTCFQQCTSLQSIPAGLFDNNTEATDFRGCFQNCTSLQSIPSGLFDSNTAVTSFSDCFYGCSSLQSIPENLFYKNVNVTSFSNCFYDCNNQNNFYTTISSERVSNFNGFGKNITVCVPVNSLTYNTISAYASTVPDNNIQIQNSGCYQVFSYTINTSATTTNAVIGEIPFVVADSSIESELVIDWGDNTAVIATTTDFASKSTHTYASPGTYQITVAGRGWNAYSFKCNTNSTDTFKKTVISIDDPIPDTNNLSLDNMFCNCTHLESIHYDTLKNFYLATSAFQTFFGCSSLQFIPARLLSKLVNLQNATSMFEGCTSITYIPSGLLGNCTSLTNASKMFKGCSGIIYYPDTLLINNTSLSNRTDMFAECSNTNPTFYTKAQLESNGYYVELHDTTLSKNEKVGILFNLSSSLSQTTLTVNWGDGIVNTLTSSSDVASYIHQYSNPGMYFISIQSNNWSNTWTRYANQRSTDTSSPIYYRQTSLIEVVTCVSNIQGTIGPNFYEWMYISCINLKTIPSNLFTACTNATSFESCFYGCSSLQSIPEGLFDSNTAVTNFDSCFRNCSSLQSIPSGLFDKNTAVTDFQYCFSYCSSLQSIPSGLFDKNTAVTDFQYCFSYCSSLQSIPANLFHSTTTASFEYCFRNCTKLTSIDATAFKNCTNMTSVMGMFTYCASLQTVPEDLFRYNTTITAMGGGYGLFESCSALAFIPENFFKYNTAVTTFQYCFYNCYSLTNFTLYIGSSFVSSCNSFVTKKSGTTRTVYVPTDSTTYTTFNNQASTLGLTVIEE